MKSKTKAAIGFAGAGLGTIAFSAGLAFIAANLAVLGAYWVELSIAIARD